MAVDHECHDEVLIVWKFVDPRSAFLNSIIVILTTGNVSENAAG